MLIFEGPRREADLSRHAIEVAQAVERTCVANGLDLHGICCNCKDHQDVMRVVQFETAAARDIELDELQLICHVYWTMFRKGAAKA